MLNHNQMELLQAVAQRNQLRYFLASIMEKFNDAERAQFIAEHQLEIRQLLEATKESK